MKNAYLYKKERDMTKKQELVELLKEFQSKLETCFDNDVCDAWSLDGFVEHIEESILDIESEDDE